MRKASPEETKGKIRRKNPNWPNNNYNAIKEAQKKYDIVLVQLKPEHFDYFDKHNIKYSIAYPNLNNWDEVEKRCISRKNNADFIARLKKVFLPFYEDAINRNYENFYILDENMTLEDCLLKNNYTLLKDIEQKRTLKKLALIKIKPGLWSYHSESRFFL